MAGEEFANTRSTTVDMLQIFKLEHSTFQENHWQWLPQKNSRMRFREDDAGSLCRKDKVILLIGQRAWAKSAKKERCVFTSEMRSRASLILQMHIVVSQTFQGEDVLDRRNFDTLSGAIQNLCKKEKSSEEKSGLKLALGCTLKKAIRVMKGYYTQINDTDSH